MLDKRTYGTISFLFDIDVQFLFSFLYAILVSLGISTIRTYIRSHIYVHARFNCFNLKICTFCTEKIEKSGFYIDNQEISFQEMYVSKNKTFKITRRIAKFHCFQERINIK